MVVACCDSRVDPALILQCDPGDLFVVRNVANIVPPYEKDAMHHGTSAALEFGIRFLQVKHLILLGHSQCGGIQTLLNCDFAKDNDFISNWVSIIDGQPLHADSVDDCAREALKKSLQNSLTFPWIRERVDAGQLAIHLWYFDIKTGSISSYAESEGMFKPL
jgi:carbonic anhydrase